MKSMKILEINSVPYGSTCRIMLGIKKVAEEKGIRVDTASGYSYHPVKDLPADHYAVGGVVNKSVHMLLARFTGLHGCFSWLATKKLLQKMDREQYDIVHLHNLHGWYINLPMLFGYIKKHHIRTVWTLHDCWTMTGQCPYFNMAKCDKWKTGCGHCPQTGIYPKTYVDISARMWHMKRGWFTGVEDMTLVTPSQWLAGLVKQSYLKDYPVLVINNGIDLSVFKPTPSDFRKRCGIEGRGGKFLILGVSFGWSKYKGFDVFIELSKRLDTEKYQIVLVGIDDKTEKLLPENIISIHRTQNQRELAEIYTAADLFVNPTREDNFPTVNMEALACGTPVVTFRSCGSPETVDETCGVVVPYDDVAAMQSEIERICETAPYTAADCCRHAARFESGMQFQKYMDIYMESDR